MQQIAGYRTQAQKSRIDKALKALARTRPGGWLFVNVFPALDRWLIPRTRGRLKVALGQPILLLHTQGAKSGQLTPKETAKLERGQAKVEKMKEKAEADGKVTAKERKKLAKAQNKQSKKIYKEKHDKQAAAPAPK